MKARGLTLIELLLALGLLSAVIVAGTSWLQIAGDASASTISKHRWEVSANAVLQRIQENLVSGDFEQVIDPNISASDHPLRKRVKANPPNVLEIKTRNSPTGTHSYHFDGLSKRLILQDQGTAQPMSRLLLEDVESFEAEIDEERLILTVRLASIRDARVVRRYVLR